MKREECFTLGSFESSLPSVCVELTRLEEFFFFFLLCNYDASCAGQLMLKRLGRKMRNQRAFESEECIIFSSKTTGCFSNKKRRSFESCFPFQSRVLWAQNSFRRQRELPPVYVWFEEDVM